MGATGLSIESIVLEIQKGNTVLKMSYGSGVISGRLSYFCHIVTVLSGSWIKQVKGKAFCNLFIYTYTEKNTLNKEGTKRKSLKNRRFRSLKKDIRTRTNT